MKIEEAEASLNEAVTNVITKMNAVLEELDRVQLSEERLIAELGRIAQALEVEPSMVKVLGKIAELKAK